MKRATGSSQLGIVFLTVFIDIVGFSIIFPLFPDMLEYYMEKEGEGGVLAGLLHFLEGVAGGEGEDAEFRTQVLFGGVLGSLYSALQFAFAPVWGGLSDRVGRRPVLLLTIAGLTASYLLWIFSGRFLALILARVLGGAMSGNIAVASAAVVDSTDERNRTKGMGMLGAALGLGFFFGPALGSLLARVHLEVPTAGALGLHPFSAAAAGAFALSLANLVWVLRRFRETLPQGIADHRTARPINPVKLFHRYEHPGINRTNLAYFLFLLAFAGMEFTLTFLAKERFHYTSENMFWIFAYVGIILIVVQGGVIRRVAPRYGEKNLSLAGLILLLPGFLMTGWSESSQLFFYGGLTFLAVGSALVTPSMASLVSLYTSPERQGEVQGVFRSLGALSRAVGPIVACAIYFRFGAPSLYTAGALLLLAPILIAAGLPGIEGASSTAPDDGAGQGSEA